MKFRTGLASAALVLSMAAGASAATLQLDGYTASSRVVFFNASPVPNTPTVAGATGLRLTDTSAQSGLNSFVAWCLDVAHWLMPVGTSQDYQVTTTPFSNSYGLSATAKGRIQAVFDANYDRLNLSDGDQAAAFQMALWEAAFEGDANAMSMKSGQFQAMSTGNTTIADTFLANAASYNGEQLWNLTFLENSNPDINRYSGQNLVTASPVPVPAAGVLMLTGLAGFGLLGRRRRKG